MPLIQRRLNPGIQKIFMGSGIKICSNFGIRDQNLRSNCGIRWKKIYLVTTLSLQSVGLMKKLLVIDDKWRYSAKDLVLNIVNYLGNFNSMFSEEFSYRHKRLW